VALCRKILRVIDGVNRSDDLTRQSIIDAALIGVRGDVLEARFG